MRVEKLEMDVFNPEGRYIYRTEPPPGVPMSEAVFHESGFAVIEENEDFRIYRDYQVTNLPEVFQ